MFEAEIDSKEKPKSAKHTKVKQESAFKSGGPKLNQALQKSALKRVEPEQESTKGLKPREKAQQKKMTTGKNTPAESRRANEGKTIEDEWSHKVNPSHQSYSSKGATESQETLKNKQAVGQSLSKK